MKPMALLALAFVLLWAALLTGCAAFGTPELCINTDLGTICYSLPVGEIPAFNDKR